VLWFYAVLPFFEMLVCWSVGRIFRKILRAKLRVSANLLIQGVRGILHKKEGI
jgi:hypothetical protein